MPRLKSNNIEKKVRAEFQLNESSKKLLATLAKNTATTQSEIVDTLIKNNSEFINLVSNIEIVKKHYEYINDKEIFFKELVNNIEELKNENKILKDNLGEISKQANILDLFNYEFNSIKVEQEKTRRCLSKWLKTIDEKVKSKTVLEKLGF